MNLQGICATLCNASSVRTFMHFAREFKLRTTQKEILSNRRGRRNVGLSFCGAQTGIGGRWGFARMLFLGCGNWNLELCEVKAEAQVVL